MAIAEAFSGAMSLMLLRLVSIMKEEVMDTKVVVMVVARLLMRLTALRSVRDSCITTTVPLGESDVELPVSE